MIFPIPLQRIQRTVIPVKIRNNFFFFFNLNLLVNVFLFHLFVFLPFYFEYFAVQTHQMNLHTISSLEAFHHYQTVKIYRLFVVVLTTADAIYYRMKNRKK